MSQLIDSWEKVTDAMAGRLVEAWNVMADQIGDRPLWNEQLPERQQARQYQLVRNDPQAWASLMQEHGYVRTVEYMLRGERLSKKYPDEEQAGQESMPLPQPSMAPPLAPVAPSTAVPPTTPTLGEERHVAPQQRHANFVEGQTGAM